MINDIKIPIATYPVSSPVSESGVALSNVKPMDIAELSRLSDELAQIPSYTSQRNDVLRTACKQFDDEFRKVLNKRGISESDWKEYGRIQCKNGVNKCYYKGEYIYFYTDANWTDDTEFSKKCYFYAGEPDTDKDYVKEN